jgi:hypothetical protein
MILQPAEPNIKYKTIKIKEENYPKKTLLMTMEKKINNKWTLTYKKTKKVNMEKNTKKKNIMTKK